MKLKPLLAIGTMLLGIYLAIHSGILCANYWWAASFRDNPQAKAYEWYGNIAAIVAVLGVACFFGGLYWLIRRGN